MAAPGFNALGIDTPPLPNATGEQESLLMVNLSIHHTPRGTRVVNNVRETVKPLESRYGLTKLKNHFHILLEAPLSRMAPVIYEDMTVYSYVREILYGHKRPNDDTDPDRHKRPSDNVVRITLNFDKFSALVLAKKYKKGIKKCRRIICNYNSEIQYGGKSFKLCHSNHVIPYFVLELVFIENNFTGRIDLLIEKESTYVVALTAGNIPKITKDNEFEPTEDDEGIAEHLRRKEKNNRFLLLKDGRRTDIKRFKGPWADGLDMRYEVKNKLIDIYRIRGAVFGFHKGLPQFKQEKSLPKTWLADIIYTIPEGMRFQEIRNDIAFCIEFGTSVNTKFPGLINQWGSTTQEVKNATPENIREAAAGDIRILMKD